MKNYKSAVTILFLIFLFGVININAQDTTTSKIETKEIKKNIQRGRIFIDVNGDGYNDNAPDHDGDGIPNGLDPDYLKFSRTKKLENLPYVDLDGDGINDNLQIKNKLKGSKMMNPHQIAPQSGNNQSSGNNANKGQGHQKGKGKK